MSEGQEPPEQRPKKGGKGRAGSPRRVVRRDIFDNTTTPFVPTTAPRLAVAVMRPITKSAPTSSESDSSDDDGEEAPAPIITYASVHAHGGELVKRPRPSTSSSGGSDAQEDKRVKLTRPALRPTVHTDSPRSPSPFVGERVTKYAPPPPLGGRSSSPQSGSPPPCREGLTFAANETQHESASWPKDSTSYAGLASPTLLDVPMRPASPQPSASYSAAAAAPASPRRAPTPQNHTTETAAPTDPAPRSTYPPLVVECLPDWTRHFEALAKILGHAPNARPLGRGVRFLPKSAEEFRAVQRYLTTAAAQDSAISWYCYSPATELPVKVAIRGLLTDTPTEKVVKALCALGFPAESAREIPPARGRNGCTYFVRLAYLTKEELKRLLEVKEILQMTGTTIEAWRGGHKPPQCFRCQQYGHSSTNCHRRIRCVRCAGEHAVSDCTRPREDPTCANCSQGHAANDRRCTHYKREARRRGIAQPPPPPRAKQRQRQQQRAYADPPQAAAPPTNHPRRHAGDAVPAAAVPPAAASRPTDGATGAAVPAPVPPKTTFTPAARPRRAATAARPTTLVADANPPTERGCTKRGQKKRQNRPPRPVRTAPAAASTPQQRQPAPVGPTNAPGPAPATSTTQRTAHADQGPTSAPPAHHQAQGEAQTTPDVSAIVRVVVEALMTGLTTFLQGQGALAAIAAGMAVLTRLHSF